MHDLILKRILLTQKIKDSNLSLLKQILLALPETKKALIITRLDQTLEMTQDVVESFLFQITSMLISADETIAKEELNCASLIFPNSTIFLSVDSCFNFSQKILSVSNSKSPQDWVVHFSASMISLFSTMLDCMLGDILYKHFENFLIHFRDDIYAIGKEIITCDNDIDQNEVSIITTLIYAFDTMLHKKNVILFMPNQAQSLFEQNITVDTTCVNQNNNSYISHPALNKDKAVINQTLNSDNNQEKLTEYLNELNKLIGLNKVKQEVMSLVNLIKVRNVRKQNGLSIVPMSLHLVFSGNPGTGKTTVARLLAKIYNAIGLLSSGHLVETDRSGLVAGYVGQTAIKTQEVLQKAKGGILFIDEAYSLCKSENGNDYGEEAISTIIKGMEDNRDDLIIIMAGYPALMEKMLSSNPGLKSRFNRFINFTDYSADELYQIFVSMCNSQQLNFGNDVKENLEFYFKEVVEHHADVFANARGVRNIFENIIINQSNRLASITSPSKEELSTILSDDVLPVLFE